MKETDEIMQMIKEYGTEFFSKEKKYKIDIGIYLEELAEKKGMNKKELVRKLNLDESYGRKLFGGQRMPTRKILLQCAFILSLNLSETQRLLEIGRKACLYPRVRRDAAIIYAIDKKMSLEQANAFLEEVGEEPLEI